VEESPHEEAEETMSYSAHTTYSASIDGYDFEFERDSTNFIQVEWLDETRQPGYRFFAELERDSSGKWSSFENSGDYHAEIGPSTIDKIVEYVNKHGAPGEGR
jgi:hypothetical protein